VDRNTYKLSAVIASAMNKNSHQTICQTTDDSIYCTLTDGKIVLHLHHPFHYCACLFDRHHSPDYRSSLLCPWLGTHCHLLC